MERHGLLINSTAGYVAQHWSGILTLAQMNVTHLPITRYYGMSIGQISFFKISSPAEPPYGSPELRSKYHGQSEPTASACHRKFAADEQAKAPEVDSPARD